MSVGTGRLSFRFRLLAAIAALAAFGLCGAGGVAYLVERQRTDARIEASLGRSVEELRKYAGLDSGDEAQAEDRRVFRSTRELVYGAVHQSVNARDECTLGLVGPLAPWAAAGSDEMCAQVNADAELVAALRAVGPGDAPAIRRLDTAAGGYAYAVAPVALVGDPQTGVYAVVLDRDGQLAEVTASYLRGYLPIALGCVVLITAGGWILSGQVLRPLRRLVATTRSITGSDIGRRVPVIGSDEVAELSVSINLMLDSLEAAFVSERRLLDDVGHELRTPLTIIRGHLELADPADADFADTKALALDEIDRMRRLVDSLVTLAQADGPDFVRAERCQLAPLVDEVLDKARSLGDRRWRMEGRDEVTVMADPQRLTQALLELAQNAVKHSSPGSVIAFDVRREPNWARVSVRDQGAGIAPAALPHVFERFTRAERSRRTEGAGLGLAIVDRIATAHGGRTEVASRPGQGARFTVVLPRLADPEDQT